MWPVHQAAAVGHEPRDGNSMPNAILTGSGGANGPCPHTPGCESTFRAKLRRAQKRPRLTAGGVGGFNRVADFPVAASAQTSRVSRKSQGANLGFFHFKMALDSPF
jgi:hypothetical protein